MIYSANKIDQGCPKWAPLIVFIFRPVSALVDVFHDIPTRLASAKTAKQNSSVGVNVVSVGSPSRMRMVRRISLGSTRRPSSSQRLVTPVERLAISVDFMFTPSFALKTGLFAYFAAWRQGYCLLQSGKISIENNGKRASLYFLLFLARRAPSFPTRA